MNDDPFFERLRDDAAALRPKPDEFVLARIRARIHERIAPRPTVAQLLAAWFRPLAATLTVIAIAAAIGLTTVDTNEVPFGDQRAELEMGGDTYSVSR